MWHASVFVSWHVGSSQSRDGTPCHLPRQADSLPLSYLGSPDNGIIADIVKVTECYQTFCCQRDSHSTNKPLALLLHSETDHCWLSSLIPSSVIRQDPLTVLTGEDLLGFILISYPRPSGVCIVTHCVRSGEDTKPYKIYVLSLQIKWHG